MILISGIEPSVDMYKSEYIGRCVRPFEAGTSLLIPDFGEADEKSAFI